jgi:uncharacterized protein (TIGR02145 family)
MSENLNYPTATGSLCYDNIPANCDTYGRLYKWETAMTACPNGWHLPSDDEWNVLMRFVQEENGGTYIDNTDASVAGKYLKAKNGWEDNDNGEDKYGFAALPGGFANSGGLFFTGASTGYWWSASENDNNGAYKRVIYQDLDEAKRDGDGSVNNSFSVRCVMDY